MLRVDGVILEFAGVIEHCHESHGAYRLAAEEAQDPDLSLFLDRLSDERQKMAHDIAILMERHQLSSQSIKHGQENAPSIHKVFLRLKSALLVDRRIALIEECEKCEMHLSQSLIYLSSNRLNRESLRTIKYYEAEVTAARGCLHAIRIRLKAAS